MLLALPLPLLLSAAFECLRRAAGGDTRCSWNCCSSGGDGEGDGLLSGEEKNGICGDCCFFLIPNVFANGAKNWEAEDEDEKVEFLRKSIRDLDDCSNMDFCSVVSCVSVGLMFDANAYSC